MTVTRKALCAVYGAIALLALIGTWGNNLEYLHLGFLQIGNAFVVDTFANPASRSLAVDILFLGLAVFVWMVLEARRLGMRWVWLYVIVSFLVAISVTVPLFLLHRERALAARDPAGSGGKLTYADAAALVLLLLGFIAFTAATFTAPYAR